MCSSRNCGLCDNRYLDCGLKRAVYKAVSKIALDYKVYWDPDVLRGAPASWFDNVMINHDMSLKVTMFFETFLVITSLICIFHILIDHDLS